MKEAKNNHKSGFGGAFNQDDFRQNSQKIHGTQNGSQNANSQGENRGGFQNGFKGGEFDGDFYESHENDGFENAQNCKSGAQSHENAQARHNAKQAYAEDFRTQGQENQSVSNAQNAEQNGQEIHANDELIACQAQLAELKDKYMRANAEFENIKKRLEKEKASALAYANENFARDLLDVLDALEAAANVEAKDDTSAKIKEGVENTLSLFMARLAKHGIKPITQQENFDPNLHEAMNTVQSEQHASSAVVDVYQKGYLMGERVLRPSKVSVAK